MVLKNPGIRKLAKKGKIVINIDNMQIKHKSGKELTALEIEELVKGPGGLKGDNSEDSSSISNDDDDGSVENAVAPKSFIPILNR